MAIMFFDGFDQYASVPVGTEAVPCSTAIGLDNITTVPTDPSIITPTSSSRYSRILGDDDRVWRTLNAGGTVSATGAFTYVLAETAGAYNSVSGAARYGVTLDAQAPLTTNKKLVIGFKNKLAWSKPINSSTSHLLAVFSSSSNFTSTTETFGLILVSGSVYICNVSPGSYGYIINVNWQSVDIRPQLVGGNYLVGPSNFVVGTASTPTAPTVPPIDQLPANTVEIEVTVEGKVTCWINNQYVGAAQFIDPAKVANIRYIKTGLMHQYYGGSGSGTYYYGFNGITDLYLLNGLGTRNTTRLGKVKVVSRSPATDASVQFQRPDTATSNAQIAAQNPPLFSPSLTGIKEGDTDLYGSTAFKFTNESIVATSVTTTGYKTDPSGNDIAPVISVSGTKYVGNTNIVPISASLMKTEQSIYELNPKTGQPFTKTDLDATTFGVTVVAPVVVEG